MQIQVVKSKIHRVKVAVGDALILIAYAFMDIEEAKIFKPSLVFPNAATNLLK